jgi:hypothetical protein
VEGTGSMRSYWYRGARADKTFVRVAFDSSDRNEGVLLYDPSQQVLIQLDGLLELTSSWKPQNLCLRRDDQFAH